MTWEAIFTWGAIGSGLVSAVMWGLAAVGAFKIPTDTFWDRPPPHVIRQIARQAWLNGAGAAFAAVAVGCQAAATYFKAPPL